MIIYKITNLINNKIYVGKTSKSLEERFQMHINKSNQSSRKMLLHLAMYKYSTEHFIIEQLEQVNNNLDEREIYWIKKLKSSDKKIGYNIHIGGTGGDTITNNPNREEIIKKHIEKGLNLSSEHLDKFRYSRKGKKHTIESKNKISKSKKGVKFSKKHKENISKATKEAMKDIEVYNKRPIGCYNKNNELINKYDSLAEASRDLKISVQRIYRVCKGIRKTTGSLIFKYLEE